MQNIDNESDRQTGRSTGRRLLALGHACLAVGTEVEFIDHMPNTRQQAMRHRDILHEYIVLLKLPAKVVMKGSRVFVTVPLNDRVQILNSERRGDSSSAPCSPCPYCMSDDLAIRDANFDQTCQGCVDRMTSVTKQRELFYACH